MFVNLRAYQRHRCKPLHGLADRGVIHGQPYGEFCLQQTVFAPKLSQEEFLPQMEAYFAKSWSEGLYLIAIDHGTMKYKNDLHIRDVEVRAFEDNAIVMGVLESAITLYGDHHHSVNRFTMLWTPSGANGAWQMNTWQSTAVPAKAD